MAVVIEDITDEVADAPSVDDGAHAATPRQDDDDEFHDAADSEDSYEDATEHFDVDALSEAQQRAQQAAEADVRQADAHAGMAERSGHTDGTAGAPAHAQSGDEAGAGVDAAATAGTDVAAARQGTPGQPQEAQQGHAPAQLDVDNRQHGAAYSDDDGFAAAGPAYADEGPSFQERHGDTAAAAAGQQPFDDDAWGLGQRFREPHGGAAGEASAGAESVGAESVKASADPPEGQAPEADLAPPEEVLTPEQIEERTAKAEALKQEGNALYAEGQHAEAQAKYSEALDAAPPAAPQRAVYFANRAAAALKLQQWSDAAVDCTSAIAIDGGYVKAYMRRASAYEQSDDLDRALADYKKTLELDPGNTVATAKTARLEPVVAERREKMKEEMIGKLKDLGNTVLGKFGMSLDNFKAVQDPATGSYSINFQ